MVLPARQANVAVQVANPEDKVGFLNKNSDKVKGSLVSHFELIQQAVTCRIQALRSCPLAWEISYGIAGLCLS